MILIKNNKIVNAPLHSIDSYAHQIKVIGDIPSDSFVAAYIGEYWFPLKFVSFDDEGAIFSGEIVLTGNILQEFKENRVPYYFTFKVNDCEIEGRVPFGINLNKLHRHGRAITENDYKQLLMEVAKLERRLEVYLSREHTDGKHIGSLENIKPGMVPIAVDSYGHFKYDYPFYNIEEAIKGLSEIILKLSESNQILTARVSHLEQQLHEHLHGDIF